MYLVHGATLASSDSDKKRGYRRVTSRTPVIVIADVLNALLVGLFLVGYLARYVHPSTIWLPQVVAVVLPFLAFAMLAVFGARIFAGHWIAALTQGPFILLILIRFAWPLVSVGPPPETERDGLTIVTLNANSSEPAGNRGIDLLLSRWSPDLVALQEAHVLLFRDSSRIAVQRQIQPLMTQFELVRDRPDSDQSQTFSRLPVFLSEALVTDHVDSYQQDQETGAYVRRIEFTWSGRRVALYNVHLASFGQSPVGSSTPSSGLFAKVSSLGRDYALRSRQVDAVKRMLDSEDLPFIVVGDFNSTPHNWEYAQLVSGLQDSRYARVSIWAATFPAEWPILRIDHVLASPHWTVMYSRISEKTISDHRAVVATLWLPNPQG